MMNWILPRNQRGGQEDRARRKTRGLDALKKRLEGDMREIAKRLAASREPDLRGNGSFASNAASATPRKRSVTVGAAPAR